MKYLQHSFSVSMGPEKIGPKTADLDEVFGRKEKESKSECDKATPSQEEFEE